MFELTLARLGEYIATKFELDKSCVAFVDKEMVFSYLSKNQMPLTLPAITYFCSDFSDPNELRPIKAKGDYNVNLTSVTSVELIPIELSISIAMLASNLDEYFKLSRGYWRTARSGDRYFTVEVNNPAHYSGNFNCVLSEHSSLTTPPGGKEGRDFDRGLYYVLEGSFNINSYAIFHEDFPVIRKEVVNWNVGKSKLKEG